MEATQRDIKGRTDKIMDEDTGMGSEITGHDKLSHLQDNLIDEEHAKIYNEPVRTIMDESLGTIVQNTLSFLTYSGDNYMKAVSEAELLVRRNESKSRKEFNWRDKVEVYVVGFSLFCREGSQAIYLGVVILIASVIIYLMSIGDSPNVSTT